MGGEWGLLEPAEPPLDPPLGLLMSLYLQREKFKAVRNIDPESVDVAVEKCERCIEKLDSEIQEQKSLLQKHRATIVNLRTQLSSTGNQSVQRSRNQSKQTNGHHLLERYFGNI